MAELGIVGVTLAVPGLIALLTKVGIVLKDITKRYNDAKPRLNERGIILQDYLHKLHLEIEEFTLLSPDLPQDLCAHFVQLFIVLKQKITGFDVELEELLKADKLLGVKTILSSIDKMIEEVNFWQRKIEDFLELLARIPKPFKDPRAPNPRTALGRVKLVNEAISIATEDTAEALNLSESQIPGNLRQLPNSPVFIPEASQSELVEVKAVVSDRNKNIEAITNDVADLAKVLSAQDIATRGILRCTGYRREERQVSETMSFRFLLVFSIPDKLVNPRSLREVLLDKDFKGQIKHPLNERVNLAKQLARAVLHVHSKNHVHKNIRPETILLFDDAPQYQGECTKAFPVSLGTAFLTGFERVRKDEADTVPIDGPMTWAENIYRHPSRQGASHSDDKFTMLHDVYSLGVCLLEIAMWRSFVEFETRSSQRVKVNNTSACNLMERSQAGLPPRMLSPHKIHQKFVRDARNRIPIALGSQFSSVVVRCLTCVETFESEAEEDPLILSIRYIETVLWVLEEIVI